MKYKHALLIIFLILFIDQWSKVYVKTHFFYNEEVFVLGDWFRLHFLENEGMAFGMTFGDGKTAKLILTVFRLLAVSFGFYFIKTLINKHYHKGVVVCASLILAGAFGNLIDSIFYGKIFTESVFHVAKLVPWGEGYGELFHGRVVDMLYFPMVDTILPSWVPIWGGQRFTFFDPVFNVADVAISTGVITLLVFQNKFMKQTNKAGQSDNTIADTDI